jgi:NhaA family Na+:H+ antiporter
MRCFGAVVRPLQAFLRLEAASGILLLLCAVGALTWANFGPRSFAATFDYPLTIGAGGAVETFTVRALINDGLMTLFFFVVGMEIKRELVIGELDSAAKASLPGIAALGGMVLPAGIFLACTWGEPGQRGWGIPMATDIAFCVGVLTLLADRVPRALVVFVTALAIFDDIGGILVIAVFYGHGLSGTWLLGAALVTAVLLAMNRAYVVAGLAYALVGAGLWVCLHRGGIHATIAGVVVGLMIPVRPHEDREAPIHRFMHLLHPFVAFLIMPIFALANSGVWLRGVELAALAAPVTLGTAIGLSIGKLFGIFGLTMLAVRLRFAPMPAGASAMQLLGISAIAGIGFTVALFIAALAFHDMPELLDQAKIGILLGSAIAGTVGFAILWFTPRSAADCSTR